MGYGSLGHGGSSSLSNLSPLAPPFTFDRSTSVIKANPFVHSTEEPYSYAFKPSVDNWLHLHPPTRLTESFSNPNLEGDKIQAAALPSATGYGYLDAQSMSPLVTHLPSVNPITTTAASPFPSGQHLETVTTTLLEVEPYYPHYASKTFHEMNCSEVLKEPGCDILSTSCFAPLDESSRSDNSHSLPGLGYTTQWGGFWNGLPDGGQEITKDLEGNLLWKEKNGVGSPSYKSSLEQGRSAGESLMTFEKAPGVLHRECVDVPARKSHMGSIGTEWIKDKWLSVSEELALSSTEVLQEPYPQVSSPIPVMKPWKTASYKRCFTPLDLCKADRTGFVPAVPNSSSNIVCDPPTIDTSSSALKTNSPKNAKFSGTPKYVFDNAGEKDGTTSEINNGMGNDHLFVDISPMKKDRSSNHQAIPKDVFGQLFKEKSHQQATHSNLPDAFTLTPGGGEAGRFVENSLETFDHFNPVVDSPCWKGALASRSSPFRVTDAVNPQLFVKELESHNCLNLHGPRISPVRADNIISVSSKEQENVVYNENECFEAGSSSSPGRPSLLSSTQHKITEAVKMGSYPSKVTTGYGIQYSNDSNSTKYEDFHLVQSGHENNLIQLPPEAGIARPTRYTKDAGQNASLHAMERLSNSSCSIVGDPGEPVEPLGGASKTPAEYSLPKIDVHVLVDAIHNLSELLLVSCSKDVDALKKQDHNVLQHAIDKLDVCVQKKVRSMTQIPESRFPRSGVCIGKITDLDQATGSGRPLVRGIRTNDVHSQHGYQDTHGGEVHSVSNRKGDNLPNFVSINSDTDMKKDNDMTQAIEKILKENCDDNEEMQPQALLYRNLWLEAEAALCSMYYKARYARMKIEMGKFSLHQERGVAEMPINLDKSPKVSEDLKGDDTIAPETGEESISHVSTENATQTNITCQDEEVEASVMARFRILKHRVENSSSLHKEVKQLPYEIDVGSHAGAVEKTFSPCLVGFENAGIKSQPTNIVDLNFAERRKPWPYVSNRWKDGSLDVRTKSGTGICEDEIALNVFEEPRTVKDFHVCVSDIPVIESYISSRFPVGGYDSPSSDWEHVRK